jgi:ferredoxin
MTAVIDTAQKLGWSDDGVHRESFGARSEPSDKAIEVELALLGMTLRVEPGTTILDALIDAGAFVSYECRRGECGTCQMHVLARSSLRLTRREDSFNLSQSRRDAKDFLGGLCGFARDMIEI